MVPRRMARWDGVAIRAAAISWLSLAILATAHEPVRAASNEPTDSVRARPSAMQTRIYFGMWSTHLRDINRGLGGNSLIGLAYRGYYGATFINSFGDRAITAGLQRSFSPGRTSALATAVGYRAGLITGYDERFFGIGDKVPALPFVQIVGSLDWHKLGVELAYAGIVASVAMNMRL